MKYFKFSINSSENSPFVLLARESEQDIRNDYKNTCVIEEISEDSYKKNCNSDMKDRFEERFAIYCKNQK